MKNITWRVHVQKDTMPFYGHQVLFLTLHLHIMFFSIILIKLILYDYRHGGVILWGHFVKIMKSCCCSLKHPQGLIMAAMFPWFLSCCISLQSTTLSAINKYSSKIYVFVKWYGHKVLTLSYQQMMSCHKTSTADEMS